MQNKLVKTPRKAGGHMAGAAGASAIIPWSFIVHIPTLARSSHTRATPHSTTRASSSTSRGYWRGTSSLAVRNAPAQHSSCSFRVPLLQIYRCLRLARRATRHNLVNTGNGSTRTLTTLFYRLKALCFLFWGRGLTHMLQVRGSPY